MTLDDPEGPLCALVSKNLYFRSLPRIFEGRCIDTIIGKNAGE